MGSRLAMLGGQPACSGRWPKWPRAGRLAKRLIEEVLASDRWSISGPFRNARTLDQRVSEEFAERCNTKFAYTMDHGSSALVAALLALEVGPGDEVIIPGLTWVACATAVLRVNALPVPVDVCPRTLCIDPAAAADAISDRTRAIMVVHLYSAMADLEKIMSVAAKRGIAVIEDCAHTPGAIWNETAAGSIGQIGAFSFHQEKPLCAGEGGMVVTSNDVLARKLEQIRADGRRYSPGKIGHQHLSGTAELQGFNFCMPEICSALLLDALDRFDEENAQRTINAATLDQYLEKSAAWRPVNTSDLNRKRTYYQYAVRFDPEHFEGCSVTTICEALEAELGFPVTSTYAPMNRSYD